MPILTPVARAGRGVCMGFFFAMPRPAVLAAFKDALVLMRRKNAPDQPPWVGAAWVSVSRRYGDAMEMRAMERPDGSGISCAKVRHRPGRRGMAHPTLLLAARAAYG